MAARRKIVTKRCASDNCNVEFQSTTNKKYCSNKCKALASYHRRFKAKKREQLEVLKKRKTQEHTKPKRKRKIDPLTQTNIENNADSTWNDLLFD